MATQRKRTVLRFNDALMPPPKGAESFYDPERRGKFFCTLEIQVGKVENPGRLMRLGSLSKERLVQHS